MASLRDNGRYGTALLIVILTGISGSGLTLACVSTDERLFDEVAVPQLRSDDPLEIPAPSAAVADDPLPAAGTEPSRSEAEQPAPLVLAPPSPEGVTTLPADQAEVSVPPPPPPPPYEPCAGEGLLLCDSFEDAPVGAFPRAAFWLPELSGCGTHRVDGSHVSRSGAKSLRVEAGGYPECMLHAELDTAEELYLRSWVRLGPEPELREQYLSLLELGPREAQDEPELRIGLRPQGGGLCGSKPGLDVSVSGLEGGPSSSCSGFALEPERWYCLQAHVKRQAGRLAYELSLDGASVLSSSDVHLAASWNDQRWYFKVGRAAYGQSPRGSLWHDDVAVGREPLPCGP